MLIGQLNNNIFLYITKYIKDYIYHYSKYLKC
jgi:hypothetical protein